MRSPLVKSSTVYTGSATVKLLIQSISPAAMASSVAMGEECVYVGSISFLHRNGLTRAKNGPMASVSRRAVGVKTRLSY